MHSLWALQLSKKKGGELHLDTPSATPISQGFVFFFSLPISQVLMEDTSESQEKEGDRGVDSGQSASLLGSLQKGWSSLPCP